MTPTLRPARAADLPGAVAMMGASTPWRELGYDRERCTRLLRAGRANTCVAVAETLLGFLCLERASLLGQPYIKLLCVAAAARGRGIGRALVEWAEREAFEQGGARNLFLLVSSFNTPARAFYTHLGFVESGVWTNFLVAGADEILMRKTRGPLLSQRPSPGAEGVDA